MKLSKAQQEVMERAKAEIDYARTHDFLHCIAKWHGYDLEKDWDAFPNPYLTNESVLKDMQKLADDADEYWHNHYKKMQEGHVTTQANSRTLKKLEQMGLIEIVYDSNGTAYGIDRVKVLNY